jgi:hypothetical protein
MWLLSTRYLIDWLLCIHARFACTLFSIAGPYDLTALIALPGDCRALSPELQLVAGHAR